MQIPGARDRTDNIIAALNNDAGNMPDAADIFNQIIVGREERVVHEVVTFDARESERKLRVAQTFRSVAGSKKSFEVLPSQILQARAASNRTAGSSLVSRR